MDFSVNLSVVRCLAIPDLRTRPIGKSAPYYFSIIMKKLLTLIFLSLISLNVIHAEITWNLSEDGTLTISGTDMPDYSNPHYAYTDYAPWYSQRDKIKKVIIENGVKNIGNYAFVECSELTSITITKSVKRI